MGTRRVQRPGLRRKRLPTVKRGWRPKKQADDPPRPSDSGAPFPNRAAALTHLPLPVALITTRAKQAIPRRRPNPPLSPEVLVPAPRSFVAIRLGCRERRPSHHFEDDPPQKVGSSKTLIAHVDLWNPTMDLTSSRLARSWGMRHGRPRKSHHPIPVLNGQATLEPGRAWLLPQPDHANGSFAPNPPPAIHSIKTASAQG